MKQYLAKYYPVIGGKEVEYKTSVMAQNITSAESALRKSFIEQLKRVVNFAHLFNAKLTDCNIEDLEKNIEYAKEKMRVEIICQSGSKG